MTKKVSYGLVAVLIVSLASTVAAAGLFGDHGHHDMHGIGKLIMGKIGRMLVLKSELNVTDEQKEKIHTIVKGHVGEIRPVAESILADRRALREAVVAEDSDPKKIRAAAKKLGEAIGDASVLASSVVAEARQVLTNEQWERIREHMKDNDQATDEWVKGFLKK